jgi:hypothetical protein
MGRLREIKHVQQKEPDLLKRWFTDDDYWDIYIWTDHADEIVGIQICYNRGYEERALTWVRDRVFDHTQVNPGRRYSRGSTPILMPDGYFDNRVILEKFLKDSVDMERRFVYFIKTKINEFKNELS